MSVSLIFSKSYNLITLIDDVITLDDKERGLIHCLCT